MKLILIIPFLFLWTISSLAQQLKKDSSGKSANSKEKLIIRVDFPVGNKTSNSFSTRRTERPNSTIKVVVFSKKEDTGDGWFIKYVYPVVLLLVGVMIPLFIQDFNEKKKIRKVGERWTAEIISLEFPIKKQIEQIEKYLIVHNQNNLTFPDFEIIEGLDCEIFKSLDKGELLKFLEQNKILDYQKAVKQSKFLNGYINIVKGSNTNLQQKFKEYSQQVSHYLMKVTENLTALSRAFGNYSVLLEQELLQDPIHDSRFISIQNLFDLEIEPFRETGQYEIYRLHDNFLIPFLYILSNLRHDFRTNEMAKYIGNCIDAIKGIKMEKNYVRENFEIIISRYNENLLELPDIVRLVEQTKKAD